MNRIRIVIVAALIVPACGRLRFDAVGTAGDGATTGDARDASDALVGVAAPVNVQAASGLNGGSTLVDTNFNLVSTSGNLIAVAMCWESLATLVSVTDTNFNAYTLVGSATTGVGASCQIAYAKNIIGGGALLDVTAQISMSTTSLTIVIDEISGADPTDPFASSNAQFQGSPGSGTDILSTGPLAFSGANNFVFATSFNTTGNSAVITPGTGFTMGLAGNTGSTTYLSEFATQLEPATFSDSTAFGSYMTLGMAFRPGP